MQTNLFN